MPQGRPDETNQVSHKDPPVPVYAVANSANSLPQTPAIEENTENSLDITANDRTWISVKFEDGKSEEAILSPGDSKSWKFSDRALLKIGNAGGITIHCNGKDMGILGNPGQVKTLSLPEY
jgi:flagellar basal body rod protein FlgF